MNNQQIFTKIGIKLIPIGGARSLLYRIVRIMKEAGKNLGQELYKTRATFCHLSWHVYKTLSELYIQSPPSTSFIVR